MFPIPRSSIDSDVSPVATRPANTNHQKRMVTREQRELMNLTCNRRENLTEKTCRTLKCRWWRTFVSCGTRRLRYPKFVFSLKHSSAVQVISRSSDTLFFLLSRVFTTRRTRHDKTIGGCIKIMYLDGTSCSASTRWPSTTRPRIPRRRLRRRVRRTARPVRPWPCPAYRVRKRCENSFERRARARASPPPAEPPLALFL